jgi:Fe-S oxidoreductase
VKERFLIGYNDFVLPFMIGMCFIIIYLLIGAVRIIIHLPKGDRKKYLISLIIPKNIYLNIKDIICDVLLHVKIWKRKPLLGYMHSSIAFGWFMLIVLGHIETWLYTPERAGLFYYPIFFRYFVMETNHTLRGSFFFFLMDLFLLIVLSGVALAMFKRIRSKVLGMRRTTKNSLPDRIAMYCLWAIFPLRLLAEGFTAGISGGSFLTKPLFWLFSNFLSNDYHILPTWWAYSSVLGLFFILLPFTRYMHIPTEAFFITLRNAGLKVKHPRKGYAEAMIYSCSSCGLCIDACPMGVQKKNLKYSSVYFIRFLRRRNKKKCEEIADKCLQCGKCVTICPVGVDSCGLKIANRAKGKYNITSDYSYLCTDPSIKPAKIFDSDSTNIDRSNIINTRYPSDLYGKVLYYAGCMSQLTPSITSSVTEIMNKSGVEWSFMDQEGGICCGRPLILAGRAEAAAEVIKKNSEIIKASGADTLLLSCPICLKVFKENYDLKGINIVHYTQFIDSLIKDGKIALKKDETKYVFHDPCELGRGCGIYKEPRNILKSIGILVEAAKGKDESICCGGSLGSITLSYEERSHITDLAIDNLTINNPQTIITACPLCLKTFGAKSKIQVKDIAEIVKTKME